MTKMPNMNADTSVSRCPAALLTGASRGIGRAIALQLAKSGYDLFLLARKEQEKLEDCAALCRATGVRVVTRLTDISDSAACAEAFSNFDRHFSALNLLVANAGISHLGLLQDMTPEDWDHMIRTDLSSCFYLSRLAIPRMLRVG
ncbi:SDR family NAD(P)-dependent oxidoreductase, partial [Stomatobaculum longum]|uniref:SDR family NAD(P)-dependent oxidoreductase n=1 Tax=Stomatobaculum longum TaxID=796942 RepID=UPI002805A042